MSTLWSVDTASFVSSASIPCLWYWINFSEDWTKMLLWAPSALWSTTYVSSYNVWKNFGDKIFTFCDCDGLSKTEVWKASAIDNLFIPTVPMIADHDIDAWKIATYKLLFDQNQTNLTVWSKYYLSDTAWQIQTTAGTNEFEVWIAIEPTILKLKQTY
jgi:hypothetical protein